MKVNPDKRKAVYVIEDDDNNIWVEQKRPKIKDRDEYRPFWEKFDDAEVAMDRIATGNRVTLYQIKGSKIESFRVRKIPNGMIFTSRDQAKEQFESISASLDFTITKSNVSIFYQNKTYTITGSDKRFSKLRKACIEDNIGEVIKLLNIKAQLKKSLNIYGSKMEMSGHEVPNDLATKFVNYIIYDNSKVLNKFKKRLDKNPSKSAQRNLLKFLSYHGACILEDGRFLAYKYLNENFHDCHTGRFDYSPGKTVTMPRDNVVEDHKIACAAGLHVGSWGYSGGHSTIVVCVIDPVDVVSVPDDYGYQKIRCCKVKSVKPINEPIAETTLPVSFLKE